MENLINYFKFESETEPENENQEKRNKVLKIGGILILCFLLLCFVLVVIAMNRTSEAEISSPSSTGNFSAAVNQTNETDKQLEALENDNGELEKLHKELKEHFESLSKQLDRLLSNISSNPSVSFLTPPPENEDPENPAHQPKSITSCSVAMEFFPSSRSKNQTIYPHGNRTSVEVVCDFESDGGGWTLIQKRTSGPMYEFSRNWIDYKNGFGSLQGNFWLGLDNIRALTKNGDQELRIELEDFEGEKKWAKYSNFSISDSSDFYRLTLTGFYGNSTAGDSMTESPRGWGSTHGSRFSTKDKDNDVLNYISCVLDYGGGGGWWFHVCSDTNLNGLYFAKSEPVPRWQGIRWHSWNGDQNSLAKTEMKIRTRKSE